MKAQIFLSCGQDAKRGEKQIAEAIKKKIEEKKEDGSELGFDCFVASEEQNLDCLRDVIFKRLEESDYFVFVDFKRERLIGDSLIEQIFAQFLQQKRFYRGSLYANQELAVASYIGLADCVLLLQEEGVEERGGMLGAVLANLKEEKEKFRSSERNDLPGRVYSLIEKKLDDKKWTNRTRNTLALNVYPKTILEPPKDDGSVAQPFHVMVKNLHYRKAARNCYVYLDEVKNLDTDEKLNEKGSWETTELKWAGTWMPFVRIAPTPPDAPQPRYRIFDAFWLKQKKGEAIEMKFSHAPSSTDYFPYSLGFGRYRLTYFVVSDDFKPVRESFDFEFKSGQTIDELLKTWLNANEVGLLAVAPQRIL